MVREETIRKMEQADEEEQQALVEELDRMDGRWELRKTRERAEQARSINLTKKISFSYNQIYTKTEKHVICSA